jgi:hypothetical protein
MAQRWFVICSEAATQRAEKSVSKAQKHAFEVEYPRTFYTDLDNLICERR